MWSFALRVSALSHHSALFNNDDRDELEAFPKRLLVWLRGARVEPTVVFKEMLGYSLKEINRLIDRSAVTSGGSPALSSLRLDGCLPVGAGQFFLARRGGAV